MSLAFEPAAGLIFVAAEVFGPEGNAVLRFALDTGATDTLINAAPLIALGYDLGVVSERVQVTTGSGVEFAPRIVLKKLRSLGHERKRFPVICHTLPPSASIDGLLGLDFLRNHVLKIDFKKGRLTLTYRRP